ncbi:unnamed protein product [Effrenium voratum]|uniref:EF-hand domain-containing protein n=1 Tax=Effrenium voratum TaxID=2562239 RepID=A0AA36NJF0_9DINO|nr:unnamed protein product [Effrenium voratum]
MEGAAEGTQQLSSGSSLDLLFDPLFAALTEDLTMLAKDYQRSVDEALNQHRDRAMRGGWLGVFATFNDTTQTTPLTTNPASPALVRQESEAPLEAFVTAGGRSFGTASPVISEPGFRPQGPQGAHSLGVEEGQSSDMWQGRLAKFAKQARLQPTVLGDHMPQELERSEREKSKDPYTSSRNSLATLSSQDPTSSFAPTPLETFAEDDLAKSQPSSFAKRLAAGRKASRSREDAEDLQSKSKKILGVIESTWTDFLMGLLVLVNAAVMAMELECLGHEAGASIAINPTMNCANAPFFTVMEHVFTWVFAAELICRLFIIRRRYFKDPLNFLDSFLVVLPIVDLYILAPLAGYSPNIHILRLLRLGKMVRAVRLMRTLRLFQGLRLLVQACSSFLPSLVWSMALLFICMLMGGLVMGNLLMDFVTDDANPMEDRVWIWTYYGTAYRSMYTMYEITFAGNWPTRARPVLETVDHSYAIFYLVYITFIVFAVIRVITAVFLRETLEAANNDAELMVQERMRQKKRYIKKLEGIFEAMDDSGDGVLSEDEMTTLLMDPCVQAYLQSLDLDLAEGEALFQLLQNGEGKVTYEDFIDGVLRCKGPARAIDQISLQCDVNLLNDSLRQLTTALEDGNVIRRRKESKRRRKRRVQEQFTLRRQTSLSGYMVGK